VEIKKEAFPKDETFRIASHRDSDNNLAYPGPKSTGGLDAPELVSAEGKEAKAFVEKMLQIPGNGQRATQAKMPGNGERATQTKAKPVSASPNAVIARSDEGATRQSILIKTTKSDKYDRYLADIFVPKTSDQKQTTSGYLYLNNLLLEQGHAVRVRE